MRGWLKLLIGVAVLLGLLAGADRLAVGVAEDEAADRLVSSGHLSARPEVSIEGFPFLTQAVSGEFDGVRLSGAGMTVTGAGQKVALQSFRAHLAGVKVDGDYRGASVRSGSGEGLVGYADAARLVPGGQGVQLEYGGPGRMKATFPLGVSATGEVRRAKNAVTLENLQFSGAAAKLGKLPATLSLSLSELPAGMELSGVSPEPSGLRLEFKGENVRLIG
ncbi:DUF2993 domain-containing protein [Kitasatospora camelliae]|uniref:DUF2993 domain-containing protein n=1 Tax=Kitasatospora camelliae TaxID=3156397 RepID=A0AAU8JWX9_9ACTN